MALHTSKKQDLIKQFGKGTSDSGSTEVQVALLTERLAEITSHLGTHPKDVSSKRGLLNIVSRRKSFLRYLERTNESAYRMLVERLGLRK